MQGSSALRRSASMLLNMMTVVQASQFRERVARKHEISDRGLATRHLLWVKAGVRHMPPPSKGPSADRLSEA